MTNKDIDLMDSLKIAKTINDEDKKIADSIEKTLPQIAAAIDLISKNLLDGGRLAYFAAGTSGRIAVLDASDCPTTFGTPKELIQAFIAGGDEGLRWPLDGCEDDEGLGIKDLNAFSSKSQDIVVGLSASGGIKYLTSVMKEAQNRGIKTIGISSNPSAKIKEFSDIFINPIVDDEVLQGSSRMKSGTAQKMILNMLSTGAMIRIGKVYKNLMVDVLPLNEKLINRAHGIIAEICDIPVKEAEKYFELSDKNVKIACIMIKKNISKPEAEKLLQNAGGILRKVI